MPQPAQRLGDILVKHNALARERLESFARRRQGRLGHALRMHGLIDGLTLARAVAEQHQLTQVDLTRTPPAGELFCPRDLDHYIAHHFVPYARTGVNGEGTLTIATSEPSRALLEFARAHYGCAITLVVTTERELLGYLTTRGATTSTRRARLSLRRRYRHLVADRILLTHQLRGLAIMLLGVLGMVALMPGHGWAILLVLCNAFYLLNLALKMAFYRHGIAAQKTQTARQQHYEAMAICLREDTLPLYSILVPMYRETTATMQRLMTHLEALDYPKEKLDIKLICEADDAATLAALKQLHPPAHMELIAVPASTPRTKPKACNLAMQRVRGEFVVIYDAEDQPATNQLRMAVAMFREQPSHLACVQAGLNYYNRDENILTQLFSIEYSALFRLLLPALERMKLPIPLGGTSNHLRSDALRAAGGWDAFNVTEDADLGMRLAYLGYTTQILPSLTLEEAPLTLRAWVKQRSRWIKGYIQTWLVYTRNPGELKRRLGTKGYYGFQFFIGAPAITFLLAPIFWLAFMVSLAGVFASGLSLGLQIICAISFVGGTLSHWLFARQVMALEGWGYLRLAFALYPLYWMLHSVAAGRALWQLITAPHYWDKTSHGISRTVLKG